VVAFFTCWHILFLFVNTSCFLMKEQQELYRLSIVLRNYCLFFFFPGKGRLYPAYSLSGSEGEADSPTHHYRSLRRQQQHSLVAATNPYQQHTYQQPYQHQYQQPQQQQLQQHSAGLSDTPTSENASDATLTDSELALARDSTLLVHNGKSLCCFHLVRVVLCRWHIEGAFEVLEWLSVRCWYLGSVRMFKHRFGTVYMFKISWDRHAFSESSTKL
jgi:hypothetical protein